MTPKSPVKLRIKGLKGKQIIKSQSQNALEVDQNYVKRNLVSNNLLNLDIISTEPMSRASNRNQDVYSLKNFTNLHILTNVKGTHTSSTQRRSISQEPMLKYLTKGNVSPSIKVMDTLEDNDSEPMFNMMGSKNIRKAINTKYTAKRKGIASSISSFPYSTMSFESKPSSPQGMVKQVWSNSARKVANKMKSIVEI
mmetsp:Transcript_31269/g.27639  ORF Transcript_31269/g.27639 Transcript_31269/m.27639 type:complete len:196 (+) Transcript_31269:175-762(+)